MAAQEVEIKFLQVDHDAIRMALRPLHATQNYEMRPSVGWSLTGLGD